MRLVARLVGATFLASSALLSVGGSGHLAVHARTFGYGFDGDGSVAIVGGDLWVANTTSVVELNAHTHALVRVVSGPAYGFQGVGDLTVTGHDLYLLNYGLQSPRAKGPIIDELDTRTGALVRTLPTSLLPTQCGPFGPGVMAIVGQDLWITLPFSEGCLLEYNTTTGKPIRVVEHYVADFSELASASGELWVSDNGTGCVYVLNGTTGTLEHQLCSVGAERGVPTSLVGDGTDVWIGNLPSDAVSEFTAAGAALVRTVSGAPYDLDVPQAMTLADGRLWVVSGEYALAYGQSHSLTEVDASTGALLHANPDELASVTGILAVGADLWVTHGYNALSEVDGASGAVVLTITGAGRLTFPDAITTVGGSAWVASQGFIANGSWQEPPSLVELSLGTGSVERTLAGPSAAISNPSAITAAGGELWVANEPTGSLSAIAPASGDVIATVACTCGRTPLAPQALAPDGADVWAVTGSNTVAELDPAGGVVRSIAGGPGLDAPEALTVADAKLWVANGDNTLGEFDASSGTFVRVIAGRHVPSNSLPSLAVHGADVWVSDRVESELSEVAIASGVIVHTFTTASQPAALAVTGNTLWVAYGNGPADVVETSTVAALNATTGRIQAEVGGPAEAFVTPVAFATTGQTLLVVNLDGDSVTILDG